jgi:hypothetical protein
MSLTAHPATVPVPDQIGAYLARRGADRPAPRVFPLTEDTVDELIAFFLALGTFGYQTTTRRNSAYIQYMPRTIRNVRRNLQRYPRFGRLQERLATFVDGLRY